MELVRERVAEPDRHPRRRRQFGAPAKQTIKLRRLK